ncbi:MAG: shikimate dehydrogenase [Bacteroidales bacterium]|nr:shikimate dehydrogenase [Bacteroidales bacterium]
MILKKTFGLIGFPLGHSFSRRYFTQKFLSLGLRGYEYQLFELRNEEEILSLLKDCPSICGLNVTSPYKQSIIPYLDDIDDVAAEINAVNTIKVSANGLIGFNTDYLGFEYALLQAADISRIDFALIFGSGGAARSVAYVMKRLKIPFLFVSGKEHSGDDTITYHQIQNFDLKKNLLFVNATPCGMQGKASMVPIDTACIREHHILFDLIYNPSPTLLMTEFQKKGAKTVDGLSMLYAQAEESWKIWTK